MRQSDAPIPDRRGKNVRSRQRQAANLPPASGIYFARRKPWHPPLCNKSTPPEVVRDPAAEREVQDSVSEDSESEDSVSEV